MRVIFCGTPQFAVASLEALLRAGHDVPLVLAQPDRPVGRKQTITAPPVKAAAEAAGIAVVQPEKIRNNLELESKLREIMPDAIAVVAYGRIIPPWMLALPKFGNINVHASLLPKYRGAAPIQWAIANGEAETGVTTMLLDIGLDTGPMLGRRVVSIGATETAAGLLPKLAETGAELLIETLAALEQGTARPEPQNDAEATLAPVLSREDGRVNMSRSSGEIYNRWRGFQPWPGAFAEFRGDRISLLKMRLAEPETSLAAGTLEARGDGLFLACGDGRQVQLLEVQLAGKKAMRAEEFTRGYRLQPGERLQ